jgi:rare lipoprotein A (peptidoglycan hydrolase)
MTLRFAAMALALMSFWVVAPAQAWHETVKKKKSTVSRSDDSYEKKWGRPMQYATRPPAKASGGSYQSGIASYYWQPQPVASGGRFNPEAMTAAHKTLPFGTRVKVTRVDNGRSVVVMINDRGPYIAGRIIDLSRRAARDIGMTDVGITKVNVSVLGR